MRIHFTALLGFAVLSLGLSNSILAQPTPVSSAVSMLAEADAGAGVVTDTATQSQAGTLNPLTVSVGAQAQAVTPLVITTVTTTGTVSASWTDSAAGQVIFEDVGWTASNATVSCCLARLNLNPAMDWSYRFTADADGVFSMNWTVTPDAATTGTFGLVGIGFYWNGILQEVLRIENGAGTEEMPVVAGQTYTVGLRNGANLSGFAGNPITLMDARMNWTIGPAFTPLTELTARTVWNVRPYDSDPAYETEVLRLRTDFVLGLNSDGINVAEEALVIRITPPLVGVVDPIFYELSIPPGSLVPANANHTAYVLIDEEPLYNGVRLTVTQNGQEVAEKTHYIAEVAVTLTPKRNADGAYALDLTLDGIPQLVGVNDPVFLPLAGGPSFGLQIGNEASSVAPERIATVQVNDPVFTPDTRLPPYNSRLSDLTAKTRVGLISVNDPVFINESLRYTGAFSLGTDSDGIDEATEPLIVGLISVNDPVFTPQDPTLLTLIIPPGALQHAGPNTYALSSQDPDAEGIEALFLTDAGVEDHSMYLTHITVTLRHQGQGYALELEAGSLTAIGDPVFLPFGSTPASTVLFGDDGGGTVADKLKGLYPVSP